MRPDLHVDRDIQQAMRKAYAERNALGYAQVVADADVMRDVEWSAALIVTLLRAFGLSRGYMTAKLKHVAAIHNARTRHRKDKTISPEGMAKRLRSLEWFLRDYAGLVVTLKGEDVDFAIVPGGFAPGNLAAE
jgi:hypothetical protein